MMKRIQDDMMTRQCEDNKIKELRDDRIMQM